MMSELKEHYMEIIDMIMNRPLRNTSDSEIRKNAVYKEYNILNLLDDLTSNYAPSEEIQFIAMYLKTKYNFDIWRSDNARKKLKGQKVLN
jgi:hypothetical protein